MAAAGAREHQRFCQVDGWTELKSARGQGRDHIYYVKELEDGTVLRTKVSHGTKGKEAYSRGLWVHIWKEQLLLRSESEFWAVLEERRPAQRQAAEAEPAQEELPVWLVQQLVYTAKLSVEEVSRLSVSEAEARWLAFTSRPELEPLEREGSSAGVEELEPALVARLAAELQLPPEDILMLSRKEAEELLAELVETPAAETPALNPLSAPPPSQLRPARQAALQPTAGLGL